MRGQVFWLSVWVAVAGCSAAIPSGIFKCVNDEGCPAGFVCRQDGEATQKFCFDSDGSEAGTNGGDASATGSQSGDGGNTAPGDGATDSATDGSGTDADADVVDSSVEDGAAEGAADANQPDARGSCPSATHTCISPTPSLWNGPVVFASGATVPACGGKWPNFDLAAKTGLEAQAAVCGCTCGDPTGTQCESKATLRYYTTSTCIVFGGVESQSFGSGCHTASEPDGLQRVGLKRSQIAGAGMCEPASTEMLAEPTWNTDMVACSGAELSAGVCDSGGVCAPVPPEGFSGLCIWRTGDRACPAGYPAKHVFYENFEDARGCSDCGCAPPTGVVCGATASLWGGSCPDSSSICGPGCPPPRVSEGECISTVASIGQVNMSLQSPSGGSCEVTGGNPNGAVTPSEPLTLCCL